jgi:Ca2+-binding RTX toxin-like protein
VANVDVYDTLPVVSPPFPLSFTPNISGGTGNNTLIFNPDSEGVTFNPVDFTTISGTNGNDNINASGTVGHGVTILGLGGDDTLTGTNDKDTIDGGDGKDTIFGLGADDNLSGGGGDDTVWGGDGNDTVNGNDGNDTLHGEAGNDTLEGGIGNDFLSGGDGNDALRGGDGDDVMRGGQGDDNLDGGAGSDTADYADSPAGVNVTLEGGKADADGWGNKDVLVNMENINGSAHNDTLVGDANNNIINGNGGDDTIVGRAGDDSLFGGDGNDRIDGEDGNDSLGGGAGDDYLLGGKGDDVLNGDAGNDRMWGEEGTDRLSGGGGADEIDGGLGLDYLEGGPNDQSTDILFLNYDLVQGAIEDLAAIGGPAFRDIFRVQTLQFAENPNAPGAFDPWTPQQVKGGAMNQTQRIDAQFELDARLDPANVIGARLIVFSDFDGGDGADGDLLEFLS